MRSCLLLIVAALVVSGCATHPPQKPSPPPPSAAPTPAISTNPEPIVTPDTSLNAKVVRYNSVGRFVVLSFPLGQMPQMGQTLSVYRAGLKVGEVKITGPQKENDIIADLTTGDADAGDDVHEQ